ncbi:hypothetical protein Cgig2_019685 [Carnegiea gigantea]|uniref:Uncharacterized protein n=1 Tax=Carnegiea gigantea TaxID=171969 RepID=A0A9Q1QBG0_9CARY|nr:hypothetical protein Cgig2_019685 [Carnegiea gigantea]
MTGTRLEWMPQPSRAEWNLTIGPHVDRALKMQRSKLFRHWRYKLKELHFVSKTKKPPEIDEVKWRLLMVDYWGNSKTKVLYATRSLTMHAISAKNKENRAQQKIKSFNGAIYIKNPQQAGPLHQPLIQRMDLSQMKRKSLPHTKGKYEDFHKLHADQIKEYGVDNLTVEEANIVVLKERPRCIRGLGAGPMHPKRTRNEDELQEPSSELQSQFTQQVDEIQQQSANHKATFNCKIQKMEVDALKREQESRDEIAKLKAKVIERQ